MAQHTGQGFPPDTKVGWTLEREGGASIVLSGVHGDVDALAARDAVDVLDEEVGHPTQWDIGGCRRQGGVRIERVAGLIPAANRRLGAGWRAAVRGLRGSAAPVDREPRQAGSLNAFSRPRPPRTRSTGYSVLVVGPMTIPIRR